MVELAGAEDAELGAAELESTREEREEEEEGTLVDDTKDDVAEDAARSRGEEVDVDDAEVEDICDDTGREDEGMEELEGRTEDIPSAVAEEEEEDEEDCAVELDCAGVVVVEEEGGGVVEELETGGVVEVEVDSC